ncbi:MAG TPA: MarR family transcriptional regulator, partial [Candidatus Omnitrophota bacterium]|nr:MarR family transcriptional regulator [Candidatus Omnitrophota bacterium]
VEITIQQFMLLNVICRRECPKMKELSDELRVTMGNITSMVDRLIEHGYVCRKSDPGDRRVVRVCLTQKAQELLKKLKEKRRKHMELLLRKISDDDRSRLIKIMEKMANAMSSMKGEIG